jgi:hypothetical protein
MTLIETLVENTKYMPDADGDGTGQPSKCEVECQLPQAALVACMDSIREAKEREGFDTDSDGNVNACLGPSVSAWTECCAAANAKAD